LTGEWMPIYPIPIIINKTIGLRMFKAVSFLISGNEKDRACRFLLKHYLKLNGKF
jgi:hypothetical protein